MRSFVMGLVDGFTGTLTPFSRTPMLSPEKDDSNEAETPGEFYRGLSIETLVRIHQDDIRPTGSMLEAPERAGKWPA